MKIAFLSLYSGHIDRGVETWTREMAGRLRKSGHDTLVFQGDEEFLKHEYKTKVVKTKINWKIRFGESLLGQLLTHPYWILLNLVFTLKCLPSIVKFKPAIVLPGNGGVQNFLIRISSWIFGWKMVIIAHAGLGAPEKWNMLMRPDHYVFPSKRGKVWADKLIISKGLNISSIPHGIDLGKFSSNNKHINIKLEKPIILCVSSLDPYKRVDSVVRAVSLMKKGSLLLLGGDRNEGKVDALAKELLGTDRYSRIRVKPHKMPSYYASSDIFTLPSDKYEAFGIVYLEALATGLPVVATNDELRKEIVGDAGILIDPMDASSYTKALEQALLTDWGDKPREQAKKFSWNIVIKKYEKLFSSLVSD